MTREEREEAIEILDKVAHSNLSEYPLKVAIKDFERVIEALKVEPCEDAVSRQEVIDAIDKWVKAENILETLQTDKVTPLFKSVHKLSPVTPTRPKGKWIVAGMFDDFLKCTRCGYIHSMCDEIYNFCPNCGAKLEGENK